MPSRPLVVLALLACCLVACAPAPESLEDRLLAPCCFRQTLADHESPVAHALRGEIRDRTAAGESDAAIEADLVARYGATVLAQGAGRDRRWLIGLGTSAAVLASLGLGLLLLRARRPRPADPAAPPAPADDRYADQLDDELAASLD